MARKNAYFPLVRAVLCLSLCLHRCHALSCEASGFCSLGQVQPWIGDIVSAAGLRAALDARSFRKEIIISGTHEKLLELTLLLNSELRTHGFEHNLFHTRSPEHCALVHSLLPKSGCAWDSTEIHPAGFDASSLAWSWRWKFMARATRLGYNVMSLDLDVLIFSDPYAFFKQPPFATVTLFGNHEHHVGLNGGFVYVQNAAPNGPATWMMKEVTERPLRALDDDMVTLKTWSTAKQFKWPRPQICLTFDQSWLDDCLKSTFIEAPFYDRFISECMNDTMLSRPAVDRMLAADKRAHGSALVEEFCQGRQPHLKSRRTVWQHNVMHIPNTTEAAWHTRWLGRSLLPPVRGKWSEAFRQQLRDDCPACPTWRDEAESGSSEALRDVTEVFAFVPQWLFGSFQTHGWDGYWSPSPTGEPPLQVMGHVHWIVGSPRDIGSKLGLPMMYRALNFTRLAEARPSKALYLTDQPVTRVLALDPSVDLGALVRNIHELHRALAGLLQLATLSDRILAWPVFACNATWMMSKEHRAGAGRSDSSGGAAGSGAVPLHLQEGLLPFVDDAHKPGYACFASSMFARACSKGSTLLPPEYHHWRQAQGLAGHSPSLANTLLTAGAADVQQLLAHANSSIAVLSEQDAVAALKRVGTEQLVYVGHAVLVEGMEQSSEAFKARATGCQGLHPHWFYHKHMMPFVMPGMVRVGIGADHTSLEPLARHPRDSA